MAINRSRRTRAARRRKRRMDRVEHDLRAEQWAALERAWGGCAYCGVTDVALQRDCVLALSRGGRYTFDNIVPACGSCNASKSNHEVTGWLRRRGLDERAFLLRDVEIRAALAPRCSDGVGSPEVGTAGVRPGEDRACADVGSGIDHPEAHPSTAGDRRRSEPRRVERIEAGEVR